MTVVGPRERGPRRKHLARFELLKEIPKGSAAWEWKARSLGEPETDQTLQVYFAAPRLRPAPRLNALGENEPTMTSCTIMFDSQASKCYASIRFLRRTGFRVPTLNPSETPSPSEGKV